LWPCDMGRIQRQRPNHETKRWKVRNDDEEYGLPGKESNKLPYDTLISLIVANS